MSTSTKSSTPPTSSSVSSVFFWHTRPMINSARFSELSKKWVVFANVAFTDEIHTGPVRRRTNFARFPEFISKWQKFATDNLDDEVYVDQVARKVPTVARENNTRKLIRENAGQYLMGVRTSTFGTPEFAENIPTITQSPGLCIDHASAAATANIERQRHDWKIFHHPELHHINWMGNAVACKNATPPAVSLAVIFSKPKRDMVCGEHDRRKHVLLCNAFQYVDPVFFVEDPDMLPLNEDGQLSDTTLKGTRLQEAVTGLVQKCYSGIGRWTRSTCYAVERSDAENEDAADEKAETEMGDYTEEDDIPTLDPMEISKYDAGVTLLNGWYGVAGFPVRNEHIVQSLQLCSELHTKPDQTRRASSSHRKFKLGDTVQHEYSCHLPSPLRLYAADAPTTSSSPAALPVPSLPVDISISAEVPTMTQDEVGAEDEEFYGSGSSADNTEQASYPTESVSGSYNDLVINNNVSVCGETLPMTQEEVDEEDDELYGCIPSPTSVEQIYSPITSTSSSSSESSTPTNVAISGEAPPVGHVKLNAKDAVVYDSSSSSDNSRKSSAESSPTSGSSNESVQDEGNSNCTKAVEEDQGTSIKAEHNNDNSQAHADVSPRSSNASDAVDHEVSDLENFDKDSCREVGAILHRHSSHQADLAFMQQEASVTEATAAKDEELSADVLEPGQQLNAEDVDARIEAVIETAPPYPPTTPTSIMSCTTLVGPPPPGSDTYEATFVNTPRTRQAMYAVHDAPNPLWPVPRLRTVAHGLPRNTTRVQLVEYFQRTGATPTPDRQMRMGIQTVGYREYGYRDLTQFTATPRQDTPYARQQNHHVTEAVRQASVALQTMVLDPICEDGAEYPQAPVDEQPANSQHARILDTIIEAASQSRPTTSVTIMSGTAMDHSASLISSNQDSTISSVFAPPYSGPGVQALLGMPLPLGLIRRSDSDADLRHWHDDLQQRQWRVYRDLATFVPGVLQVRLGLRKDIDPRSRRGQRILAFVERRNRSQGFEESQNQQAVVEEAEGSRQTPIDEETPSNQPTPIAEDAASELQIAIAGEAVDSQLATIDEEIENDEQTSNSQRPTTNLPILVADEVDDEQTTSAEETGTSQPTRRAQKKRSKSHIREHTREKHRAALGRLVYFAEGIPEASEDDDHILAPLQADTTSPPNDEIEEATSSPVQTPPNSPHQRPVGNTPHAMRCVGGTISESSPPSPTPLPSPYQTTHIHPIRRLFLTPTKRKFYSDPAVLRAARAVPGHPTTYPEPCPALPNFVRTRPTTLQKSLTRLKKKLHIKSSGERVLGKMKKVDEAIERGEGLRVEVHGKKSVFGSVRRFFEKES